MRPVKRNVLHLAALGALLVGCDGLELDQLAQRAEQQLKAAGYLSDCSAETPICEPGCGDAQQCAYTGASCECVAADHPNRLAQSTAEDPAGYDEGGALLSRPSRSTTIDLTGDDRLLAMVNTDEGSVSFFDVTAGAETRISRVATSGRLAQSEPMNVVLDPAGAYAFVANRAAGTVSRIADVRSAYPIVDAEVDLGGEPIGLALDPTGKTLWVTNWVSGYVHVLDTASMTIQRQIKVGGNPWAITITNDGDADGADEKVLVTQFFGRPRPYVSAEANDVGREGVVQVMDTYDPTRIREITLAPLERCFVSPDLTSDCFANQLLGITLHRAYGYTRAYVVSVAASPRGPVQFNHNVQALVSVIDVDTELELHDYATNLNTGVAAQVDNDGDDTKGRRFVNAPNAIEFVDRDDAAIGYVTSAGSDIVLRVAFAADGSASVGAENAFNIPTGQNPTGIVATHGYEDTYESTYEGSYAGPTAFVSNLISRDVSVLALEQQAKVKDIASGEQPAAGTPEFDIWRGKRFFNTSTGIWSKEGWGSCQSCHPMGLTDGVTWQFASGPHQTIPLDGQYASNDPTDMRALNWTAIFDETDDFENNTRGTSGGTGAIRNAAGPIVGGPAATPFAAVIMEDGATAENHQNLSGSMKFLSRNNQVCSNGDTCNNWDQIDYYIQTIRSANAYAPDQPSADRGRYVFEDGGCNKCHSGPKWTVSRTFYTPEQFSGLLGARLFEANRALVTPLDSSSLQAIGLPANVNVDLTLLAGDDSDGGTPALTRQACNVRNVGTFGAEGGADELRANQQPAQGRNGFNPPSLLSIAVGAPYFHNGAAASLDAVFDERFAAHLTAGNAYFYPTEADRADLASFLLSIDETTTPFDVIPESVICPLDFSQQAGGDYGDDYGDYADEGDDYGDYADEDPSDDYSDEGASGDDGSYEEDPGEDYGSEY